LDNFELALTSGKENQTDSLKEWLVGFQHIYSQFLAILRENGVEQFSPLNEKFDPLRQEPIEMITVVENEKDGVIIEVLQKGYTLNGKVIRPAKVKVGEFKNK
jgi:molecular chaperone GrpE